VRDRFALLARQGIPTWLEQKAGTAASRWGFGNPIDLSDIQNDIPGYVLSQIPSTPVAVAAGDYCKEISDKWLEAHCFRTFGFGILLGYELCFDPELLFVAAMLHDVGLTPRHKQTAGQNMKSDYPLSDAPCFAVRGSGVAASLVSDQGRSAAWGRTIAEAISMHLNVRVKPSRGVEAHLLNGASGFDVIALGLHKLPRSAIQAVETLWPRSENFEDELWNVWGDETNAEAHSGCRGKLLNKWLAFERRLHQARLARSEKKD
jgi:hypothetical protein